MNSKTLVYRYTFVVLLIWSIVIGLSLTWNISNEKQQAIKLAINAAEANFNKDLSIRLWATKHGGVYVPPTKKTPPNPYLAHIKKRDIVTTDGTKLTLMNPAYLIRDMMDDYKKLYGITGRVIGQIVLNPDNKADEFESKAIDQFIAGTATEIIKKEMYEGQEHIRLIKPFMMKKGCVLCHGHLGFKDGDVRGAVGIYVPTAPYKKIGQHIIKDLIISHIIIYILGILSIFFIAYRAYVNLEDRRKASEELLELNKNLDKQVKQRTHELEQTINNLKIAQNKLIETEKMSSLGSLVAGVSHEINTPIGISITGITHIKSETKKLLQSMQENKLGKSALTNYLELVKEMSESMYLSLRSAADLIRSFKQVAIDQHTEDKRKINLYNYCNEVLLSLHNKLKHTKIVVANEIDKSINITTYPGIFSQAWTNFIINSLLHAYDEQQEGQITIKGWIEEEKLYLTYHDDGKGMEEKVTRKVFNPFFTTNFGKGGSGLGLHIVHNLVVHKLDGEITCESQLGKGTTMTIIISTKDLIDG